MELLAAVQIKVNTALQTRLTNLAKLYRLKYETVEKLYRAAVEVEVERFGSGLTGENYRHIWHRLLDSLHGHVEEHDVGKKAALVKAQKKATTLIDSDTKKLRGVISQLSAQMKNVANKTKLREKIEYMNRLSELINNPARFPHLVLQVQKNPSLTSFLGTFKMKPSAAATTIRCFTIKLED